ncbi:uncharacterized protein [Ptychodera flava]|uniref:uncharacterized protein n=1 Tax=Ptychodera flava TaxID=63121 RepID=UPI00396A1EF1
MCSRVPVDLQFDEDLGQLMSDRHRDFLDDIESEHQQRQLSSDESSNGSDSENSESDSDDECQTSSQDLVANFTASTESSRETDGNASEVTAEFQVGCGCSNRCYSQLNADRVFQYRLNLAEFTKTEKDILLLAKMEQMEKKGDTRRGKIRECQRFRYEFDGYEICEKAWRFIHDISVWSYKSLKAHYKVNGIAPREHGLKGKKAHNAFSFEIIQHVVQFIMEYSNEFGLPMPAVPRGREGTPPVYLPSSITKERVYSAYVESCEQTQPPLTHVGLTTFKNVWKDCVPHIQTISPKTDVCVKCEEFRNKIMFASSEDDKLLFTSQYNEHVMKAQKRREFYKNCVQKSFEEYESLPQQNKMLGIHTPCSQDLFSVHYSFDYAQHFSLPHQSRQVGPLYFLSPMKVFCFGVCNEVCKEQINYLFTEADSIGQDGKKSAGPNNVISILHHHLSDHSLGEKQCSFHADNCGGQNKNKSVLHYMSWRTSTGLHDEIQIHFMEPGHTKCICDACFGKVRQLYRRSDVIQWIS